jgi:hypothetical protein
MQAFWTEYGFYLWGLTTALVLIALAWLGWNTFGQSDDEDETKPAPASESEAWESITVQVEELSESAPLMRATLGRTFQFFGLAQSPDENGQKKFALVVANARGDGFLLSTIGQNELSAQPLEAWTPATALMAEEMAALEQARRQHDQRP